MNDIYNVKEVAKRLNVSDEQVRRWIREGELKAEKHSNRKGYEISEYDLLDFVNVHRRYAGYVASNEQRKVEIRETIRGMLAMQTYHKKCLLELEEQVQKLYEEMQSMK